jgi:hypothetical protein
LLGERPLQMQAVKAGLRELVRSLFNAGLNKVAVNREPTTGGPMGFVALKPFIPWVLLNAHEDETGTFHDSVERPYESGKLDGYGTFWGRGR